MNFLEMSEPESVVQKIPVAVADQHIWALKLDLLWGPITFQSAICQHRTKSIEQFSLKIGWSQMEILIILLVK